MPERISARSARYIKLGEGGKWEDLCFNEGTMRLAFYEASHEHALAGDRVGLMASYAERKKSTQASFAGQVLAFYQEPEDTLWVTFAHGHLYWCQAKSGVEFFGQDKARFPDGSRLRRTIAGWSRTNQHGKPLRIDELSGRISSTGSYRSTICRVASLDRLLALINGDDRSQIAIAKAKKAEAISSLSPLIAELSPKDLELLVDLIFLHSGWRRLGITGGTQKTVDLELQMPMTGERAFVQVKSRTDQNEFERYESQLDSRGDNRMFYVYHSAPKPLRTKRKNVTLIDCAALSERAFASGLFDWVVSRSQ